MIWIEKIFLSPIWRLAVLLFCLLFCCFGNNKHVRHWSWCTILTKCPDSMIRMWHTNVLTCSSPCAACSGHLVFCCFDQNSRPWAKQQPDNTPKTCEHKIWPQIHQSDDGIWLGFQGEQLPTPNRHKWQQSLLEIRSDLLPIRKVHSGKNKSRLFKLLYLCEYLELEAQI